MNGAVTAVTAGGPLPDAGDVPFGAGARGRGERPVTAGTAADYPGGSIVPVAGE